MSRKVSLNPSVSPSHLQFADVLHGWQMDPARDWAEFAYERARHHPPGVWCALALLGYYCALYYDHHGRHFPERGAVLVGAYAECESLVAKRGIADAVAGVTALFHPEMAWVKGKTLGFLLGDTWERHVAPLLSETAAGEQSEFGGTDRRPSCRKVKV